MSDPQDETPRDEAADARIVAAAMALAAEVGWRRTGLSAVARAAGVSLGALYRRFPTRAALLGGLSRLADGAVLAGGVAEDDSETPRDRLFDVMMRRFDALRPYRDGLAAVMRDLPREPLTALGFAPHIARSMAWMLRAAGIDPEGVGGAAQVAGLVAAHARVTRVFLGDDTADLARTMAALDAELRRGERWCAALRRSGRRPGRRPDVRREPDGMTAG